MAKLNLTLQDKLNELAHLRANDAGCDPSDLIHYPDFVEINFDVYCQRAHKALNGGDDGEQ